MKLIAALLLSYLIGAFPTGYITAKNFFGMDIRKHGSGNTGATNVYRMLGAKAGLITALGDVGKAVLAIKLAQIIIGGPYLGMELRTILLICGVVVIAGHNWSIFLRFEGGKGVATTVGVLLTLLPWLILILLLIWIPIIYITRYVSLASIISGLMIPILMIIFKEPSEYIFFGIVAAIFVVYRHRSNIQRLLKGNENRIDFKKNKTKRVR